MLYPILTIIVFLLISSLLCTLLLKNFNSKKNTINDKAVIIDVKNDNNNHSKNQNETISTKNKISQILPVNITPYTGQIIGSREIDNIIHSIKYNSERYTENEYVNFEKNNLLPADAVRYATQSLALGKFCEFIDSYCSRTFDRTKSKAQLPENYKQIIENIHRRFTDLFLTIEMKFLEQGDTILPYNQKFIPIGTNWYEISICLTASYNYFLYKTYNIYLPEKTNEVEDNLKICHTRLLQDNGTSLNVKHNDYNFLHIAIQQKLLRFYAYVYHMNHGREDKSYASIENVKEMEFIGKLYDTTLTDDNWNDTTNVTRNKREKIDDFMFADGTYVMRGELFSMSNMINFINSNARIAMNLYQTFGRSIYVNLMIKSIQRYTSALFSMLHPTIDVGIFGIFGREISRSTRSLRDVLDTYINDPIYEKYATENSQQHIEILSNYERGHFVFPKGGLIGVKTSQLYFFARVLKPTLAFTEYDINNTYSRKTILPIIQCRGIITPLSDTNELITNIFTLPGIFFPVETTDTNDKLSISNKIDANDTRLIIPLHMQTPKPFELYVSGYSEKDIDKLLDDVVCSTTMTNLDTFKQSAIEQEREAKLVELRRSKPSKVSESCVCSLSSNVIFWHQNYILDSESYNVDITETGIFINTRGLKILYTIKNNSGMRLLFSYKQHQPKFTDEIRKQQNLIVNKTDRLIEKFYYTLSAYAIDSNGNKIQTSSPKFEKLNESCVYIDNEAMINVEFSQMFNLNPDDITKHNSDIVLTHDTLKRGNQKYTFAYHPYRENMTICHVSDENTKTKKIEEYLAVDTVHSTISFNNKTWSRESYGKNFYMK